MSQTVLYNINLPLKRGHPSNQDTYICPNGVQNRGVPHIHTCTSVLLLRNYIKLLCVSMSDPVDKIMLRHTITGMHANNS